MLNSWTIRHLDFSTSKLGDGMNVTPFFDAMFTSRKVAKSKSCKVKGRKEERSLSVELLDNSTLRPFDFKFKLFARSN